LVDFLLRRHPSPQFNLGAIWMSNKFLSYLVTGALGVMLVLASPAFGRGGGGGMMGGGGHGGGMGGGGHGGGMGGGHFGGMGGGHFGGAHFAHAGFSHRFAFNNGFRHRVFDRRLHRFVFIGGPYAYASYDSCYRRVWTPVGLQWVNICGDYNYAY
jgi:hypothetical protein